MRADSIARRKPLASAAVAAYHHALSLGGTGARLPELYAAAGADFGFDVATLGEAIGLVEDRIKQLEAV
jgi:hypothetical protein